MKTLIREVYESVNSRTLYTSLVGFSVLLLSYMLPR
jgi:hypothetical protein